MTPEPPEPSPRFGLLDQLRRPAERLGHYTTADAAFDKILPNGTLKMSPYKAMRDPLENELLPLKPEGQDDQRFCDELNHERGLVRLVSLTRDHPWGGDPEEEPHDDDVFGCCWARPRMWEQYGDRHRGVCLVFDYRRLIDRKRTLRDLDLIGHGEVEYRDDGLANLAEAIGMHVLYPMPEVSEVIQVHFGELFLRKTRDWEAEHELRILARRRDRGDYAREFGEWNHAGEPEDDEMPEMLSFKGTGSLLAVIVGHQFPAWQIQGAREVCQREAVPLLQVDWKTGRPRLHTARGER